MIIDRLIYLGLPPDTCIELLCSAATLKVMQLNSITDNWKSKRNSIILNG